MLNIMKIKTKDLVYQFHVSLSDIEPVIWRRIQIPAKCSFWDLHVAIQDAMGWLDCHLHAFRFRQKYKRKPTEIGILQDDWYDEDVLPGWKVKLSEYFTELGQTMEYEYDFGDGWSHVLLLEGILLVDTSQTYPRCIGGQRACPPEDCGGVPGYGRLLAILNDPHHPEYEDHVEWLKGHVKNYFPYEPDHFDPADVHFDDPKERWIASFL